MKRFLLIILLITISGGACFSISKKNELNQRRGCCSHHGGVCGCNHSRAVCCDGSYSPSCGC